jgi:quercetin dioxygenase-like cupin family protein/uncharacterized protein YndB with AHSA1/START domain
VAAPGDVLQLPRLGVRVEFRTTSEVSGGELLEFDVVGRPRGFIATPHVHPRQRERHEVLEGAMALRIGGRTRTIGPGEAAETPAGTPHRHVAAGDTVGRVRVQLRPAARTEAWLERIAQLDDEGQLTRLGYPRPVAGARLIADFEGEAHGTFAPPRVQLALARSVARLAARPREYVFTDEWDVRAPADAVFAVLADGERYPEWWRPVYLAAQSDGPAGVGQTGRQRFKGRLPYELSTRTLVTRHEPPTLLEIAVEGDLRGNGRWTLSPRSDGTTHVRFDWQVLADRPLLRRLSPVLRPAFRWNHAWAIARARDGLEPYAQRRPGHP